MIYKLVNCILLTSLSCLASYDAKSLKVTELSHPLPVTFPREKIVKSEKRVIIKQIEFKCPDSGLFANDHDCEAFYECGGEGMMAKVAKCPKDKLWNDKQKTCTEPLDSTCATLKVIRKTIAGPAVPTHVSEDRRVLYRLIGEKLGGAGPSLMGKGYHLIKRLRLVPSEQIEHHFQREGVPIELIQYYQKMKTQVPSYFLEIYEILNQDQKHHATHQVLSVVELVDLYKKRSLTPLQLIEFYIKTGQIPQELITYYQKHPVHFETEQERSQLTRITEQEILEDLNSNKLLLEQLIECFLKQGQLPEKVILLIHQLNQTKEPKYPEEAKDPKVPEANKEVKVNVDQIINDYKKNLLQPVQLIEYYITEHKIPEELILFYQKHPPHLTEEQKIQLTRLELEQILEDIKNGKLLTIQLIEFYIKHGQIPEQVLSINWIKKNNPKVEVTERTKTVNTIDQDQLITLYKKHELNPFQLIEYYLSSGKIPEHLITFYKEHPVQFDKEEQKTQLTRLTIDEILEDLKNGRLLTEQLIEFCIRQRQIPDQIITWWKEHKVQLREPKNLMPDSQVIDIKPDQLIEWYKQNTLQPDQLIHYYLITKKIPEEIIVLYQQNPPQFETEEQRKQLKRVTVEEILEDLKNGKCLAVQLIEVFIKKGEIPQEIIEWFQKKPEVNVQENKPVHSEQGIIEAYKTNTLDIVQLIHYFQTTKKLPEQLIVYFKEHPPQFESEEQKNQLHRVTFEEILEDLKNNRLLIPQLIQFYITYGEIPEQVITYYDKTKTEDTEEKKIVVKDENTMMNTENDDDTKVNTDDRTIEFQPNQLIELYKANKLDPVQLIEYYILTQTIPEKLIIYYQKHPPQFETDEKKVQLTRLTIDEIIEDLKNGKCLAVQLIELFMKQGKLDEQIISWYQQNGIKSVLEERGTLPIEPDHLLKEYKEHHLKPDLLIEYYILKKEIPQQLIVYYQKHPPKFETEEQKIQITRVTIEEILEDMKNNKLLPEQLIEFYLKQGQLPEQIIVWFQKHKPSTKEVTEEITTVVMTPEVLIDKYKDHSLKPSLLIEYYLTYHTIPQQLIIYYKKHPPKFTTEEEQRQFTRLSDEEIFDDLKNKRLIPSQLIEFYLKKGQLPEHLVVWFQQQRPQVVTEQTKHVTITKEVLIDSYKKHSLNPFQLIQYFIVKHEIPQELILYYRTHPPKFETEEQKIQVTRLSLVEILEDLKNGRLLPYQLIEFYLKEGQIPQQVIVWFQKHKPVINKETTTVVTEEPMTEVKPGPTLDIKDLIHYYKTNQLKPSHLIEWYLLKKELPQELIVYFQNKPPTLPSLTFYQVYEELKNNKLNPGYLIKYYLKYGRLPRRFIKWYKQVKEYLVLKGQVTEPPEPTDPISSDPRPDPIPSDRSLDPMPADQPGSECKAYLSDEELDLNQLCESCLKTTYTVPHPKSHKKYVVCNVQMKPEVKHVVRKCSHGLIFDKTYLTCEKKNVVEECSVTPALQISSTD